MNFRDEYKKIADGMHADTGGLRNIINNYKETGEMNNNENYSKSKGRVILRRICAASAAIALVCVAGLIAFNSMGSSSRIQQGKKLPLVPSGDDDMDKLMQSERIKISEDYSELFSAINARNYNYGVMSIAAGAADEEAAVTEDMAAPADVPMAAEGGAANDSGFALLSKDEAAAEHSETNTQVKGVDEADIVKTDGKYIYTLANGIMHITSAENGRVADISSIDFSKLEILKSKDDEYSTYPTEFYISENRMVVIATHYGVMLLKNGDSENGSSEQTGILVYDTTDKENPKLINSLWQDGFYSSSRMVGDKLFTVSNYNVFFTDELKMDDPESYVPCVSDGTVLKTVPADRIVLYGDTDDTSSYAVMTSLDISAPTDFTSQAAVVGFSNNLYCDGEIMLLAQPKYIWDRDEQPKQDENGKNYVKNISTSKTLLTLFSLNDGTITEQASSVIPGTLLNQFSMDRYNGVLRLVATCESSVETIFTDGIDTYEYDSKQSNSLYTLDSNLNVLGKIENLAPDEWIKSARFDGSIGYFVTFRQTDPLFAVDLSNPNSPKILSSLKLPGFSEYLHRFDEGLLFGIGYDADEETGMTQGMKLTMFDTSDPTDVREKHTLKIDADYSEVSYNHKAILINKDKNIIAFPTNGGYQIYGYDNNSGFFKKHEVRTGDEWYSLMRGVFSGEFFYVCKDNGISSYDMTDYNKIDSVSWKTPNEK